jgi:hypothetical protein
VPGGSGISVVAFLSQGHAPVDGQNGNNLLKAVDLVLVSRRPDGLLPSAEPETHHVHNGDFFGRSYTTSLSTLALTPAYQLLPIYQRWSIQDSNCRP